MSGGRRGLQRAVLAAVVATAIAQACTRGRPSVTVEVRDRDTPVAGAEVLIRDGPGGEILIRGHTDARGVTELAVEGESRTLEVEVVVITRRGSAAGRWPLSGRRLAVDTADLAAVPELASPPTSSGPGLAPDDFRFSYPAPLLPRPRRLAAVVEIDRLADVPELELTASTRAGPVSLESILAEVGIEARVVSSDVLAFDPVPWPAQERWRELMAAARDPGLAVAGEWHLHLLLAPRPAVDVELSGLVDPRERTASVVTVPSDAAPREMLHAVGHELGHQLNLPHPWDAYGDTRSLMTYPWRWPDWDWTEPRGYRFDAVGRHHLAFAPERCVRPGGDAYLAYLSEGTTPP